MNTDTFNFNLQIFADGADGATADAQSAIGTDNIEETTDSGLEPAQKTSFKELIKGEYKEDYEKAIQKRVHQAQHRLQEVEEKNQKLQPVLEKLALKYGISNPDDVDSILAQIDKDNSYYENYAMEKGVSVEQAKTLADAERIIKQNERRQQDELKNRQFNELMSKATEQAAALKEKYPSFDFESEMQNDQFRRLLFSGISVEDAFTIMHRDEIMSGAMAYSYNQAQQDFANTQRANAKRPVENGISSQQAAKIDDDMSKLTGQQLEKIKNAVRSGERVTPDNFRNYL